MNPDNPFTKASPSEMLRYLTFGDAIPCDALEGETVALITPFTMLSGDHMRAQDNHEGDLAAMRFMWRSR